jgi:ubiquinone/menaquinone biosynthesis C-methylase UbiE
MSLMIDPAGKEIRALQNAVVWKGRKLLEIGCGDGRLSRRLAAFEPRHIEAIDPDTTQLRLARKNQPVRYSERIRYHAGQASQLRYPDNQFDIVVFSWVL